MKRGQKCQIFSHLAWKVSSWQKISKQQPPEKIRHHQFHDFCTFYIWKNFGGKNQNLFQVGIVDAEILPVAAVSLFFTSKGPFFLTQILYKNKVLANFAAKWLTAWHFLPLNLFLIRCLVVLIPTTTFCYW